MTILNFLDSLQKSPYQGVELCPGIRKIRMAIASKGRGKAGSARVIKQMAQELGFYEE